MNTQITIAGVTFKNPVTTASGTFGSGMEYGEFVDLSRLGAVTTKGVSMPSACKIRALRYSASVISLFCVSMIHAS